MRKAEFINQNVEGPVLNLKSQISNLESPLVRSTIQPSADLPICRPAYIPPDWS